VASGGENRRCEVQEFRQRGQGPSRDQRGWGELDGFDADRVNARGSTGDADCLAQKGGLALVRFDQVEWDSGCEREDEAGKAGPGAQIDGVIRKGVDQRDKLERILDMALPEQRLVAW
jgi:hypothetical protein